MTRDKLEGLMIGLGAGVLVAAFMKFTEEPAKHAEEAIDAGPEPVSLAPADVIMRAAHT
jgi:hypothetical protein